MEATNHHNPHNDRCDNADSLDDLCERCWEDYRRWEDDGSLDGWTVDLL